MVAGNAIKYWNAKVRMSNRRETVRAMPTLRRCRVMVSPKKSELCLIFENSKIPEKHYSFSSIKKFPKVAPKQRTLSLLVQAGGDELEVTCEFELVNHLVDFFAYVRKFLPEDNSSCTMIKTRGLIQKRTDAASTTSARSLIHQRKEEVITPKNSADGWSRVSEMESILRNTPCTPPRQTSSKPPFLSLSTGHFRTRQFNETLSRSEQRRIPRLDKRFDDENENVSPPSVAAGGFPFERDITNENTPRSVNKSKRTSRSLLREIPVQEDVNVLPDASSAQRSGSTRRRIQGMDDALLCQSPSKTPTASQNSTPYSPRNEAPVIRGGFANLGNTCYMNAILQAICGVDEFSKELYRITQRVRSLKLNTDEAAMMLALSDLTSRRLRASHEEKRHLLQRVKAAVKNDAMRFSGYHQEDAQEFLSQVLDQVKDESDIVIKKFTATDRNVNSTFSNPVTANFSFTLRHEIKCESCGNVANRSENANDLPMHLPMDEVYKWNFDNEPFCSVQTLLDDCLKAEKVECRCEKCGSSSSEISHKFEKLPRCIIVYFKRYSYDTVIARGSKRKDKVEIPLFLTLYGHCLGETSYYTALPPSVKKISFSQSNVSEEKDLFSPIKKSLAKRRLNPDFDFELEGTSGNTKGVQVIQQLHNFSPEGVGDLSESGRCSKRRISFCKEMDASCNSVLYSLDTEGMCEENVFKTSRTYTVDELNFMSEEDQIRAAMEQSIAEEGKYSYTLTEPIDECPRQSKMPRMISGFENYDTSSLIQNETVDDNSVYKNDSLDMDIDVNGNVDVDKSPEEPASSGRLSSINDSMDDLSLSKLSPNESLRKRGDELGSGSKNSTETPTLSGTSSFTSETKSDQGSLRTFFYKPVGREWRESICQKLGLYVSEEKNDVFGRTSAHLEISVFDAPTRCSVVQADGNCLFRALAFCITGGREDQHAIIRQKIVEFERQFSATFRALKGSTEDDWNDHIKQVSEDGFWGSDIEIAACATMLGIEIWTYLGKSWLCYRPRFRIGGENKLIEITSKGYRFGEAFGLHLSNQSYHYSPVLEVSNSSFLSEQLRQQRLSSVIENSEKGEMEPSYRLLSVISHLGGTSNSGHYVCDVWSRYGRRWLHCDDDSICEVTEESVRQKRTSTGYIFFYIASDLLAENGAI